MRPTRGSLATDLFSNKNKKEQGQEIKQRSMSKVKSKEVGPSN